MCVFFFGLFHGFLNVAVNVRGAILVEPEPICPEPRSGARSLPACLLVWPSALLRQKPEPATVAAAIIGDVGGGQHVIAVCLYRRTAKTVCVCVCVCLERGGKVIKPSRSSVERAKPVWDLGCR